MEEQTHKQGKKPKNAPKKDLLKYQKPIFELKRNEQGKVASLIAKLMLEQKQKPQIGFLPRSNLLSQLDDFIPKLKESNKQLEKIQIKAQHRIDAKLQQIEDSSSSSDSQQEQDKMQDESMKMQVQKPQAKVLQSSSQFEFNILTYPYLDSKQTTQQVAKEPLKRIVQIQEVPKINHLEELQ